MKPIEVNIRERAEPLAVAQQIPLSFNFHGSARTAAPKPIAVGSKAANGDRTRHEFDHPERFGANPEPDDDDMFNALLEPLPIWRSHLGQAGDRACRRSSARRNRGQQRNGMMDDSQMRMPISTIALWRS